MKKPKLIFNRDKHFPGLKHYPAVNSRKSQMEKKQFKGAVKALEFFNAVPWHTWWQDFFTARQPSGRLTYLTAFNFARQKAHNNFELDIIYRAIGPKPIKIDVKDKRGYKIPHLGDWQQLRAKAYFYDKESLEGMKQAVVERLDGLEAARSSAHVVLDILSKALKDSENIDLHFPTGPVKEGLRGRALAEHAAIYRDVRGSNNESIRVLIELYLACNGVSMNGLNDLGQLAMVVGNSAAKAALRGVATGAALTSGGLEESPAIQVISRAIAEKSRIFNTPLPAVLTDRHDITEIKREPIDDEKEPVDA